MRLKTFTNPVLYPKNPTPADLSKDWRVWFRFLHAGKWHQVSRKYDLLQYANFKERMSAAADIKKALLLKLNKGWNPITGTYPAKTPDEIEREAWQTMSFEQAMWWAFNRKKKNWSEKSTSDYKSVIKYLSLAAPDKRISDFKKVDFKLTLLQVEEDRKLSAIGFNKYREYLSSLIGELVEWDILESNVIRDIKPRDVPKTVSHRPPTQDQRIAIVQRVKDTNRDYYRFLSVLYGCAIRPVEITRLRVKHLHKMESVFRMPADITKNRTEEDVAIPTWVMNLIMEMKPEKHDGNDFLFGGRPHLFLPGKTQQGKNTCRVFWNQIVKDGLKMNVSQYSLKKLSGDDLVKLQHREGAAGLLSLAKMQMRHSSEGQTSVYTGMDKEIMQAIIKDKMPEL